MRAGFFDLLINALVLIFMWVTTFLVLLTKNCLLDKAYDQRLYDALPVLVSFVVVFFSVSRLIWSYRKYKSYFVCIGFLPALLPMYTLFVSDYEFISRSNYFKEFNKEEWINTHEVNMSRSIIEQKMVIGKTPEEVIFLLGEGEHMSQNYVTYILEAGNYMQIEFKAGQAVSCELGCID